MQLSQPFARSHPFSFHHWTPDRGGNVLFMPDLWHQYQCRFYFISFCWIGKKSSRSTVLPLQKCVFVSLKVVRWRTGGGRFAFQYVSCIASFLLWFFMLVWNPCRCIYLCSSWIIVNFLYMIVVMFGYFMLIGKHRVDFSNTVFCQNAFITIFDAAESIVAVIGLLLSNMICT